MKITSPFFTDQGTIPAKYTCTGANVNPPLTFSEIPPGTESLVLIIDDPDAQDWVHWILFDMDPSVHFIDQDTIPRSATEGTTSFGTQGYGGPCPPSGTHRYFFKVYALNIKLLLPGTVTKAEVEAKMQGHVLQQAELVGVYSKE